MFTLAEKTEIGYRYVPGCLCVLSSVFTVKPQNPLDILTDKARRVSIRPKEIVPNIKPNLKRTAQTSLVIS